MLFIGLKRKNTHNYLYFTIRRPAPNCKKLRAGTYRSVIEQWIKNTPKGSYMKKISNGGLTQKGFMISTLSKMLEEAVNEMCSKRREQIVDTIKDQCALLRLKEVRKEQLELLKVLRVFSFTTQV